MFDAIVHLDRTLTLALNGSDCLWLDQFAFLATKTVVWIPLMIAMLITVWRSRSWRDTLFVLVCVGLCVLIADQVASGICKPYFQRFRPTHDPELAGLIDIVNGYRGGKYGFFSSHASNTFSVAIFFALLLRKRWASLALFAWALLNCWTRVYLGVHFVGDLLVGTIFGILTGCFVWWLYKIGSEHFQFKSTTASDLLIAPTFLVTILVIAVCGCF